MLETEPVHAGVEYPLQRAVVASSVYIVIPKSINPSRIASNLDVFDFELNANEMATISSLDDGTRLGRIHELSISQVGE